MSDPVRVLLVGASGLIGQEVLRATVGRNNIRLTALARREVPLPTGARMEVVVAPVEEWARAIAAIAPQGVICALGTTWRAAGRDEGAFRAVDEKLVLEVATAARASGADRFTFVSSAGADPAARALYLRVKGQVEQALTRIGYPHLAMLQPGLLRGERGGEVRALERLASVISPLTDIALHGARRKYRSIEGAVVARAALRTMQEGTSGRAIHTYDDIQRLARQFGESK